ncbi:hypothetical protein D3C80_716880 [compost metagenome]
MIDDRRSGCDQVEVELALEALLDDFQMQQAEEAAAETETESGRRFHFEREGRIVEAKLAHRRAQVFEIGGIDREETAEHHRLGRLEARQCLRRRLLVFGNGIADAGIGNFLDRAGEETDFARTE